MERYIKNNIGATYTAEGAYKGCGCVYTGESTGASKPCKGQKNNNNTNYNYKGGGSPGNSPPQKGADKKQAEQETTTTETFVTSYPGLKTVILWIYNINQNGSANIFHEELSNYLKKDNEANVLLRDLNAEAVTALLENLSMSKEIVLKDLGIRLVLFIINCNQNGSANNTEIAFADPSA